MCVRGFLMHCLILAQENIVMETLTIRENITFSATLRLPRCTAARERDEKVSSVIEELGLTSVADRIVSSLNIFDVLFDCGKWHLYVELFFMVCLWRSLNFVEIMNRLKLDNHSKPRDIGQLIHSSVRLRSANI